MRKWLEETNLLLFVCLVADTLIPSAYHDTGVKLLTGYCIVGLVSMIFETFYCFFFDHDDRSVDRILWVLPVWPVYWLCWGFDLARIMQAIADAHKQVSRQNDLRQRLNKGRRR